MQFQQIHSTLARVIAATTGALAAMLVMSLLAMPTMSASGARVPHSHSLFLLPGHHHAGHGHHGYGASPGQADEIAARAQAATLQLDIPRLQQPTSQASKLLAAPLATTPLTRQAWRRLTNYHGQWSLPDGLAERPDPPPPQRAS